MALELGNLSMLKKIKTEGKLNGKYQEFISYNDGKTWYDSKGKLININNVDFSIVSYQTLINFILIVLIVIVLILLIPLGFYNIETMLQSN